ncbi:hypothetical protein CMI46_01200 [Candidatus Pacearchaeota archaeon]|nr:hypothetical protein [Candidatus Pacearchaeota archaeon]|tara:strand:+ start:2784 stop:2966 length:183 start_codon:yes stop_codon:yes gene_type:complete
MTKVGKMFECACGEVEYGEEAPEECSACGKLDGFIEMPEEIIKEREADMMINEEENEKLR